MSKSKYLIGEVLHGANPHRILDEKKGVKPLSNLLYDLAEERRSYQAIESLLSVALDKIEEAAKIAANRKLEI